MNFTEVVAEVMSTVKRPDKLLEARRAVNASVLFYSTDAEFKRDVEEVAHAIAPLEYSANLPYTDFPRFRKFRYIKRGGTNCHLKEINIGKISCEQSLTDAYYLAGSGIRYSLSALAATLDVAYLMYPPNLTDAASTYWMLESNPFMIIDRAISVVFNSIGDDASSKRHEGYANVSYLGWRGDQLATSSTR